MVVGAYSSHYIYLQGGEDSLPNFYFKVNEVGPQTTKGVGAQDAR